MARLKAKDLKDLTIPQLLTLMHGNLTRANAASRKLLESIDRQNQLRAKLK